jgi:hypothetical protein
LVVSAITESPVPLPTRVEAGLLWMLCILPSWIYLGQNAATRRPIPFLSLIGLLYGLYYALPPAIGSYNQHYRIVLNPARDYDDAVFAALLGWLALGVGYLGAHILAPTKRISRFAEVSSDRWQWFGLLLMTSGLLLEIVRRFSSIPVEIAGILSFVTSLGWFGTGLLVVLAVQKRLPFPALLITYLGIFLYVALALETGLLSGAAWFGTVLIFAGLIGNRGLKFTWVLGLVVAALAMVSLRGVTDEYRRLVWDQGEGGSIVGRTKLRLKLLETRAERDGLPRTISAGFESTSERSANLDVIAEVIRQTPSEVPYWEGETYLSLVGSFVPRFLWPDKPTKMLGQSFGHRYGFLDPRDEATSFNFPILVEAYANFGMAGVAVIMWLCGVIYTFVERAVNNPGQEDLLSLAGIVLVIPLTNIESDFSLGFGGLVMNGVALWLVLRAIRGKAQRSRLHHPPASSSARQMSIAQSGL